MSDIIISKKSFTNSTIAEKAAALAAATFWVGKQWNEIIKWTSSVKLLWVQIDDKLNKYIGNICKSVGNQLNSLIIHKPLLGLNKKNVIVLSFQTLIIFSSFKCWHITKSLNNIESLQKGASRYMLSDHEYSYAVLLMNSSSVLSTPS